VVNGWDKLPGPDNDYNSGHPTVRQNLFIYLIICAVALLFFLGM
jgi:hypothetical protein